MVDVVITGVSARVQMAEALRGFAGLERRRDDEAARPAAPHEIAAE
jgi:hypothetical protein